MSKSKFGSKFFDFFKKSKKKDSAEHELDYLKNARNELNTHDQLDDVEFSEETLEDSQEENEYQSDNDEGDHNNNSEEFLAESPNEDHTQDLPPSLSSLDDLDEISFSSNTQKETIDSEIDAEADSPPSLPYEVDHSYDDNLENQVEEQVEATLGAINLEKFRQENKHLVNDQTNSDISLSEINFREMQTPNLNGTNPNKKFSLKDINFAKAPKLSFFNKSQLESLNFETIITKFFSAKMRPKWHQVFVILFSATLCYVIGKSIALFVNLNTKPSPTIASASSNIIRRPMVGQEINKITNTNLFNLKNYENEQMQSGPKKQKNFVCLDAQKPTGEPLTLLDTVVLQDSVKSIASVQMRGQRDLLNVREGEDLGNNIEVSKIQRLRLILKNNNTGECEYVQADELNNAPVNDLRIFPANRAKAIFKSTNPEIKNEGNNFKITKQYRDKMLSNISEVLTQAKAIQITNPDGSLAFKMTDVIPGSIYSQLNIQNDDIITSINGKKIQNLNELTTLLGNIREIDHFQIGVSRNGTPENLEYNFQ